ncbi:MAG: ABC transporter substrate-binding protein [Rhodospirillales bacterium]|nr:ABC transporter substrate-binding protein [Rhodospirillales bacterium]
MPGVLSRRSTVKLGAALAAGVAEGHGAAARAAVRRGGKLVFARGADCQNLDPVQATAAADLWLLPNLYDTLLAPRVGGGGFEPSLATGWTLAPDGLTLTLTLRPGVRFADGRPLTPTDVAWSLDRARDPANGPWARRLAAIVEVVAVGTDAITIRLGRPDPSLPAALAAVNAAIVPAGRVAAAPGGKLAQQATADPVYPPGTGAFVIAEWKRGQVMVLRRNPYSWRRAADRAPLPYLDLIELPVVADETARLAMVQSGAALGAEFVPDAAVAALRARAALRVETWPSTRVTCLVLNARPTLGKGRKNPMQDVRVRRALNHAVDKQAIVAAATAGLGQPMTSYMSKATPLHAGRREPYPFDLALAKKQLAEAGFASGFELTALVEAANRSQAQVVADVQRMWHAVGVTLKVEAAAPAVFAARDRAGDFDLLVAAWSDPIADPAPVTAAFAYSPDLGCLHSGWKDATVDALFRLTEVENDPAHRAAEYRKLQEIYISEAPIVFLYETPFVTVWRQPVSGFVERPLGAGLFAAVSL